MRIPINAAVFGLGFILAVQVASAQKAGGQPGGTAPGGSTGGGSTTTPTTPSIPTTPTTPRTPGIPTQPGIGQTYPAPEMSRPAFLSGKVMMEDGAPPPDIVSIERVCSGSHRVEGYTDSKGRFSFQIGHTQGIGQDASVGFGDGMSSSGTGRASMGGFGNDRMLSNCELRAALPGFRSEVVSLNGRRALDNPDVGTIILHRLANVEGTTVSATSLQAPKEARKAYEKGRDAVKKQKWAEAQKSLEKAVELYPKYAAAWYELGISQQHQERPEEAQKAFEQGLAADPKYLKPYLSIAGMLIVEKKWQEAADVTDRLLRLDPVDFPVALLMNAIANVNMQKLDAAEKSAREAVRLDTDHRFPKSEYVLGVILANRRDYAGALPLMKGYVAHAPGATDLDSVRKQIAEIERISAAQGNSQAIATQPQPAK